MRLLLLIATTLSGIILASTLKNTYYKYKKYKRNDDEN